MATVVQFPANYAFRPADLRELSRWGTMARIADWYVFDGDNDDSPIVTSESGNQLIYIGRGGPDGEVVYFVFRDRKGWIRQYWKGGEDVRFTTLRETLASVFDAEKTFEFLKARLGKG